VLLVCCPTPQSALFVFLLPVLPFLAALASTLAPIILLLRGRCPGPGQSSMLFLSAAFPGRIACLQDITSLPQLPSSRVGSPETLEGAPVPSARSAATPGPLPSIISGDLDLGLVVAMRPGSP